MKTLHIFLQLLATTLQFDSNSTIQPTALLPIASQAFRKLLATERIRDVQFITRNSSQSSNTLTEELIKVASPTMPVTNVKLNGSMDTELLSLFPTSSMTLISYICVLRNTTDILDMKHFSYLEIYAGSTPRMLVIAITSGGNDSFELVLKHLSSKRIINLTIMELPEASDSIIVHYYNPFLKYYTRQAYNSTVHWFPDKLQNLYGFPIRMDMVNRPGQSVVIRNSQGYPVKLQGPDKRALVTLIAGLNFTVVTSSRENEALIFAEENGMLKGAFGRIQRGETELLLTTVPYLSKKKKVFGHTYPFDYEKWCVVVPTTYDLKGPSVQKFLGLVHIVVFIATFWSISKFLRFSSKFWQPLYIYGMLFTISVSKKVNRSAERFALLGIILISSIYTTTMYLNLTMAQLQSKTQVVYKDFKELYESGLTPVVNKDIESLIFEGGDKAMRSLRRKAVKVDIVSKCGYYLLKNRNVSCFMEAGMAEAIIRSTMTSIVPEISMNFNLCYWTPLIGYLFHKHSPYIDRFSDILLRMQESGIRSRWYLDYFYDLTPKNISKVYSEKVQTTIPLRLILIGVSLAGYVLSFVVFLAEVVIHRCCNKRNNQSD